MSKVNPRLVYWIRAVYDCKALSAGDRDTLICLAVKYLDYETGSGFCGTRTLTDSLGKDKRTILRALGAGRNAGLLEQTHRGHRRGDGSGMASEWQLLWPPVPPQGDNRRFSR